VIRVGQKDVYSCTQNSSFIVDELGI